VALQKEIFIKDLVPGRPVRDIFIITDAKTGQAKNGPYWSLVLADGTGSVEAKIWSPQSQAYGVLSPGMFVLAEGMAGSYRDKTQVTVDRLEILSEEAFTPDMALFIASSARSPADLLADLEALCRDQIRYKPWRKFCFKVLSDPETRERLLAAPGAKAIHHSYLGGLLEHTLAVSRICAAFCDLYPALDRDTLMAAAMFHDLGKAWELTSGIVRDYTDPGRLLGHIILGLEVLEPFLKKASSLDPELIMHFKHIIVSHHGEYAFGSPKRPKTPEGFVLHFADNADSKLNTVFGAFAHIEDGDGDAPAGEDVASWSPFMRSLDRFVYNPRRAPKQERAPRPEKPKAKGQSQCSLPLKA
jgi:3'-5' exoribonuclease